MIIRIFLSSIAVAIAIGSCVTPQKQAQTAPPKEHLAAVKTENEAQAPNPLFKKSNAPYGAPRFDLIKLEHFAPAFAQAMEQHRREIATIVDNAKEPTFANTIEALERSGALLVDVLRIFFGLRSANTNDEMEQIAVQLLPQLIKHRDDITLNKKLFERIQAVYKGRESLTLNAEQATLLDETYKEFVRGGAELAAAGQKELRELNEKLAVKKLSFGQNILKENNKFELVLSSEDELIGLTDPILDAAKNTAIKRGHEGKWVFTLHKPSLIPFLQYSKRRDLREKMFSAYIKRGNNNDEFDNKKNLKQIVALRLKKAKILGYETFADFVLEERMAKTPKAVLELLDKLWKPALRVAKSEARALQKLARKKEKTFKLMPWDWWFYAEKLRNEKYKLIDSELRPYFKLDNVRDGAFTLANKLYGIQFIENKDIPVYHPDVKAFEVREEDGTHLGVFYIDSFPRPGKKNGAWCGSYRVEYKLDGQKVTPVVTNVTNLSMPTSTKPALISLEEVLTVFHEFGHALHNLLAETTYQTTGDNIKTDFTELPSQVMENWATQPEMLKMYARHYETNEPIPNELIKKIKRSRKFNQGFETVEYLAAAYLDLSWHMLNEITDIDTTSFEKDALAKIGLIPEIAPRYHSTYFSHIFAGDDYAAGYYSYIWSEVLDADAFQAFTSSQLFDREKGQSFRDNVLSRRGAEDPMVLYKRFRGAEPQIGPLLRRKGF